MDFQAFADLATPARQLPLPLAAVSTAWALCMGLVVGSFLNVVIARLPQGLSVITPRSRCPRCETQIAWHDNVPVLSWLLLRGRCRGCRTPISARYPLIELLGGVVASSLAIQFGLNGASLELFVFAMMLIALAFIDIDTWTVPYELLGSMVLLGTAMAVLGMFNVVDSTSPVWLRQVVMQHGWEGVVERAIGLVAGFLVLASVNVVFTYWLRLRGRLSGEEWAMGWGDPLLLGAMGAVLGWHALPPIIFLASVQGSVVGIILQLTGRMPGQSEYSQERKDDDVGAAPPSSGAGPAENSHTKERASDDDVRPSEDEEWVPPPTALPFVPFLALAGLEVAFLGATFFDLISPWAIGAW